MVLRKIVWATELVAQGACGNNKRTSLKHCVDEDKDCQNAPHEKLIEASTVKKVKLIQQSGYWCSIVANDAAKYLLQPSSY